jgi:serine/threonine protein phosphatase PrpC
MLCPLCHTENRDNAKFCKGCGRVLIEEGTTSQQSIPAQADAGLTQPAQAHEAAPPAFQAAADTISGQSSSSSQPIGGSVTAASSGPATQADTYPDQSRDISTEPTQILLPQQMLALHQKRWKEEAEREQRQSAASDISEMPTMSQNMAQSATSGPASDIADYPTIITPPMSEVMPGAPVQSSPDSALPPTGATQSADATLPSSSTAAEFRPAGEMSAGEPSASEGEETGNVTLRREDGGAPGIVNNVTTNEQIHEAGQDMAGVSTATASTSSEESSMEQMTGPEAVPEQIHPSEISGNTNTVQDAGSSSSTGQTTAAFPLLAVGTLVDGRYEVNQVISDSAEEHVYDVIDRQGYQQCWNCGSKENAEGDEFCNDCGAELLNAPYIMHEYPAQDGDGDARVLQGSIVNTLVYQGHTYVIEQPQAAQISAPNGVHLLASSDSDAGTVRRNEANEDSTLTLLFERVHESISSPVGIFIVADGMGGHANGQGASRATIALISERIVRELIMPPLSSEKSGEASNVPDEDSLLTLLHGSIEDANGTLCQINQRDKTDMGSTLTGFMMVRDHAYIFNVGDSRTYMLRDEKLYQLTNDHSLVGQLVAGGLIEPDDVYTHPQRNQIFRSIGDKPNVQIDLFKQQVHPGDILLSCSDGLWEMVRDPQITEILNQATDPQTASRQLIEAANANGGEDNVSAVVVFVR